MPLLHRAARAVRRPGAHPPLPLAALALLLALLSPAPAAAHTRLRSSAPAPGASVADTLSEIRLSFTEPVVPEMTSLVLTTGAGTIAEGKLQPVDGTGRRVFAFRLPQRLAAGPYTAVWRSAAADGHVIHGTLTFTVTAGGADTASSTVAGPAATQVRDTTAASTAQALAAAQSPAAASGEDAAPADDAAADEGGTSEYDAVAPLPLTVRWLELVSLLATLGAVAFNLLVVRRLGAALPERVADRAAYGAWHIAAGAAALGALTLVARLWLQSRAIFGPEEAFEGERLEALLRGTVWGSGWILQAVATVAYFVGLMVARAPHGRSIGWMGAAFAATLLAAVPALSGHASATERFTAVAIVSDWLHVLGAGVWLGTLGAVLLAGLPAAAFAGEGQGTAAFARMTRGFSPVALAGAGTAGVTGIANSLFHLSAVGQLWGTWYGRMLVLKLALLAVVAMLGYVNWRRVLPVADTPEGARRLRRNAAVELGNGIAVILVTAALVALPTP
ncbi:MAG TPA: CopD family protein [Longimicrobium sp.]|nr:CopD family protein [Longimicrobium sp.]